MHSVFEITHVECAYVCRALPYRRSSAVEKARLTKVIDGEVLFEPYQKQLLQFTHLQNALSQQQRTSSNAREAQKLNVSEVALLQAEDTYGLRDK